MRGDQGQINGKERIPFRGFPPRTQVLNRDRILDLHPRAVLRLKNAIQLLKLVSYQEAA